MRYTPKGTAITKLGLALNRKWKSEDGTEHEEVTFVDCDAFGRTAEVIAQYFRKGRLILIVGRLKLDTWEDKNTHQKQSKLKVVVEGFEFTGQPSEDGQSGAAPRQTGQRAVENPQQDAPAGGEVQQAPYEDDVPF
jgi:single-strand DNA-binding protein